MKTIKKRFVSFAVAVILLLGLLPISVSAAEIVDSGSVGNFTWTFDSEGVLRIDGTGAVVSWAVKHKVKGLILGEGITDIAAELFELNQLEYLELPGSCKKIRKDNFRDLSKLKTVKLHEGVEIIGERAFRNCWALAEINFPESLTEIGERAFYGCESLSEIILGANLKTVGNLAFGLCYGLKTVKMADAEANIGGGAFGSCTAIERVEAQSLTGWLKTKFGSEQANPLYNNAGLYIDGALVTDLVVPDGIERVEAYAFTGYDHLKSVTLPDSVTSVGAWAFGECSALKQADFGNSVEKIEDRTFQQCRSLISFCVPDSVTSIGTYAFIGCTAMKEVLIGNSVKSIGEAAFYDCKSLTTIVFPDSLETIEINAFADCPKLNTAVFGRGLTHLEERVFMRCDNLQRAYFYGDAPTFDRSVIHVFGTSGPNGSFAKIAGLTMYYIEGTNGWVTPTWGGIPVKTWVPGPFIDVLGNSWYAEAVAYAKDNGLMNGVTTYEFAPEKSMTRAMLVTVLWRYAGEPIEGENVFDDVTDGQWYTDAVSWASENGIVTGINPTTFKPDGNITREQMATILYRYANYAGLDTSKRAALDSFPDGGKVNDWAMDAMQWCVAEGIIGGSDGKLLPQGNATRAQVAMILMRFIENLAEK